MTKRKDYLLELINSKGDCYDTLLSCVTCPVEHLCRMGHSVKYKEAVRIFVKEYNKEDLLEVFI